MSKVMGIKLHVKRIISLVLAICVVMSMSVGVLTQNVYAGVGGVLFTTVDNEDGTVTIKGYDVEGGLDVEIPETIDSKTVTSIGGYAFYGKGMSSVTLPSSIKTIGSAGFAQNNFKTIVLPEGLTSIDSCAFFGNDFTTLTIPNNVTSIGSSAFSDNKLTTVTILDNVKSIGDEAFDGNQEIPQDLTIRGYADTAAQTYAIENNHTFVIIGGASKVVLTDDSLGTPGDSKITGLDSDSKYKVIVDSETKYVKADGTLSTEETEVQPLTGTEITGLSNGTTYKVEIYKDVYTVTFDTNGAASMSPVKVIQGNTVSDTVEMLEEPTKSGYTFGGWYTDNKFVNEFDPSSDKITEDITIYAKWVEELSREYTVTFDTNGAASMSPVKVIQGNTVSDTVEMLEEPTKSGYTFGGWYTDNKFVNEFDPSSDKITEDITIYAKWVEELSREYTVTFDTNGAASMSPVKVIQGNTVSDTVEMLEEPTKSGYTFGGWYTDNEFVNEFNPSSDKITEDITIYAKWVEDAVLKEISGKINAVTEVANSNFGYSLSAAGDLLAVGANYELSGNLEEDGAVYIYDLNKSEGEDGYERRIVMSENFGNLWDDDFGRDVNLFQNKKGTFILVGAQSFRNEKDQDTGAAFLYDLDKSEGDDGYETKIIPSDATEDIDYGKYVALNDKYAIVGAYTGGSINEGAVYVYDRTASDLQASEMKIVPSSGETRSYFGRVLELENDTLVVSAYKETDNTGAVYIYDLTKSTGEDGFETKLVPEDLKCDSEFGKSLAINKGKLAVGAYRADNQQGCVYVFDISNINDIRQILKLKSKDIAKGDCYGRSVSLSDENLVVGAYKADINGKDNAGAAYLYDLSADNVQESEVKFVTDDLLSGDELGRAILLHDNYVFIGAADGDGDSGLEDPGAVYFSYLSTIRDEKVTVTFVTNGAEEIPSIDVKAGSKIESLEEISKSGYTFGGWYTDSKYVNQFDPSSDRINENTTLYAKWIEELSKEYTVTFVTNGAAEISPIKVKAGDTIKSLEEPTKSGYTFEGWYTDNKFVNTFDPASDKITGNITLYVKWVEVEGTVVRQIARKIKAGDEVTESKFGYSLSVAGNLLAIGSPEELLDSEKRDGAVYVYDLTKSEGEEGYERRIVALESDESIWEVDYGKDVDLISNEKGTFLVVGSPGDGYAQTGTAYLYDLSKSESEEGFETKLIPGDSDRCVEEAFRYGHNVAINDKYIVIGAFFAGQQFTGQVYVYDRTASNLEDSEVIIKSSDGESGDLFGAVLALEDNTLVVSSYNKAIMDDDIFNIEAGTVYIYDLGLTQGQDGFETKLVPSDVKKFSNFGISLAIEDNNIAVGAIGDNSQGAVYIFNISDLDNIVQTEKIKSSDITKNDNFGYSVSLSNNNLIVGSLKATVNKNKEAGAAYIYDLSASDIIKSEIKVVARDAGVEDELGVSVLICDGQIFIGTVNEDGESGVDNSGAVYYSYLSTLKGEDVTVTFNSKGGSSISPVTVSAGNTVTAPTQPTKRDYTFGGWYRDSGCKIKFEIASDIITQNITLYAKWIEDASKNCTITFNTNGGTSISPITVTNGNKITAPTEPTKSGYTFGGWYTDRTFNNRFDVVNDTVTSDITLYAKWIVVNNTTPTHHSNDKVERIIVASVEKDDDDESTNVTGTMKTSRNKVEIEVDKQSIKESIDGAEGRAFVRVLVPKDKREISTIFSVKDVEDMSKKELIILIQTDKAIYQLPTNNVDLGVVYDEYGNNVDSSSIEFEAIQEDTSNTMEEIIKKIADIRNVQVLMPSIDFEIKANYKNKSVKIDKFKKYVTRKIALAEGVDPSRITTATITRPDGSMYHVPTYVQIIDNKYYAVVNSLTNSTYTLIYNEKTFDDIDMWAKPYIENMASRLVVEGETDNIFEPNKNMSRGNFTKFVVKSLGLAPLDYVNYDDVDMKKDYAGYIQTASEYEIINGIGNGLFAPEDNITREEAMTILYRIKDIIGHEGNELNVDMNRYEDYSDVSNFAIKAATWNVNSSIIEGKSDTKLDPKANITKAEVATVLQRILQKAGLIQ